MKSITRRVLGDADAHHVDDVALVAWNALVEERHVERLDVFHTRDALVPRSSPSRTRLR